MHDALTCIPSSPCKYIPWSHHSFPAQPLSEEIRNCLPWIWSWKSRSLILWIKQGQHAYICIDKSPNIRPAQKSFNISIIVCLPSHSINRRCFQLLFSSRFLRDLSSTDIGPQWTCIMLPSGKYLREWSSFMMTRNHFISITDPRTRHARRKSPHPILSIQAVSIVSSALIGHAR